MTLIDKDNEFDAALPPVVDSNRPHVLLTTQAGERMLGRRGEVEVAGQRFLTLLAMDAPDGASSLLLHPNQVARLRELTEVQARMAVVYFALLRRLAAHEGMYARPELSFGAPSAVRARDHRMKHPVPHPTRSGVRAGRWARLNAQCELSYARVVPEWLTYGVGVRAMREDGEGEGVTGFTFSDPETLWWPLTAQGEMLSVQEYQRSLTRRQVAVFLDDVLLEIVDLPVDADAALAFGAAREEVLALRACAAAIEGPYLPGEPLKFYSCPPAEGQPPAPAA